MIWIIIIIAGALLIKLVDIGITRDQSSRFQKIAAIPEEVMV